MPAVSIAIVHRHTTDLAVVTHQFDIAVGDREGFVVRGAAEERGAIKGPRRLVSVRARL